MGKETKQWDLFLKKLEDIHVPYICDVILEDKSIEITQLNLNHNEITTYGLNKISDNILGEKNPGLSNLVLNKNKITDVSNLGEALKSDTKLQKLYLAKNEITDMSSIGEALQL